VCKQIEPPTSEEYINFLATLPPQHEDSELQDKMLRLSCTVLPLIRTFTKFSTFVEARAHCLHASANACMHLQTHKHTHLWHPYWLYYGLCQSLAHLLLLVKLLQQLANGTAEGRSSRCFICLRTRARCNAVVSCSPPIEISEPKHSFLAVSLHICKTNLSIQQGVVLM